MILQMYLLTILAFLSFFIFYSLLLICKNFRARQYYKKLTPNLPFAPNGNLISGQNGLFMTEKNNCKTFHEYHQKLGKTYGLFRFDRLCVSTLDLDLMKEIILDEPDDHASRPLQHFPMDELEVDTINSALGKQWLKIRRAFAPALSVKTIKSSSVQMDLQDGIKKLIGSLEWRLNSCGSSMDKNGALEIDLDDFASRYSMNTVFTSFFKQPNKVIFNGEKDHWCELMHQSMKDISAPRVALAFNFPILHSLIRWYLLKLDGSRLIRQAIKQSIIEGAKLYMRARKEIEQQRKGSVDQEHDNKSSFDFELLDQVVLKDGTVFKRGLLDIIIDRLYDGTLTTTEFLNSASFLNFATERTLCDALVRIIYYLSKNNQVQEKLRAALIREGIKCEYLDWVIKETIRLCPPVPVGCSRVVTRHFRTKEGYLIPKGTSVYAPPYSIHRLKEYWGEDAEEFRPERWVNEKHFHSCQFVGFGLGKRACLGKEMALAHLRNLILALCLQYKFEKSDKPDLADKFSSPVLAFLISDAPIYAKVSRLSKESTGN